MRIRDLLIMSSGQHSNDVAKFSFDSDEKLTRAFLALPVQHKPGRYFFYNTPGSYMLSAIVQKVTGMTTLDYLRPRLFDPLGNRESGLGHEPAGNFSGRIRAEHPHRGYCAFRPALFAEREMAREAVGSREVGGSRHLAANVEWEQSNERLGAGGTLKDQPVAATGAWTADGVYTAKVAFYETPFCLTFTLDLGGDQLKFDCEYNVISRGPTKQPQLIGRDG